MTQYIDYNSENITTWSTYPTIKNQTICSIPTDNYKKYYRTDSKLLNIETFASNNELYRGPNMVRAINRDLTINDIPAKMFCSVDCNNIGNIILTNNELSLSVLYIAREIAGEIIAELCCFSASAQEQCKKFVSSKVYVSETRIESHIENAMEEYMEFFDAYVGTVADY
jgi:hypothetical protein